MQEFLLAVTDEDVSDMDEAAAAARRYDDLVFKMPKSISWTTEGVRFEASPPGLDREREVQLRRFWLSHNNGALSYHLSFSHFYGAFEDNDPPPFEWTPMLAFRSWRGVSDECSTPGVSGIVQARGR